MKTTLLTLLLALAMFAGACSSEESASKNNGSEVNEPSQGASSDSATSPETSSADVGSDSQATEASTTPQSEPVGDLAPSSLPDDNGKDRAATVAANAVIPSDNEPVGDPATQSVARKVAEKVASKTEPVGEPADPAVDAVSPLAADTSETTTEEDSAPAVAADQPVDSDVAEDSLDAPEAEEPAGQSTAVAESPEALSPLPDEIVLQVKIPEETMKSRNYPFTQLVSEDPARDEEAQASKTEEDVQASFGVEVQESRQPQEPADEPQATPEKKTVPQDEQTAELENKEAEKADLGVGFGAPEMPEPEPQKPVAKAPEPVQPKTTPPVAKKPKKPEKAAEPKLRKSSKKDRVVIKDVPVQPLSPDKPMSPDAPKVTQQFKDFAVYWVDKISSNYVHGVDNKEVLTERGEFVARYTHLDKNSLSLLVKEKPYDHTPFVGLMKYVEYTYESRGSTPEEALNGNFERVERLGITEIFRYSKGKWIE